MKAYVLLTVAPIALVTATTAYASPHTALAASAPAQAPQGADVVITGVARGRDRLDSATATGVLREAEIAKLAPRSIGEPLRHIPGMLSAAPAGGLLIPSAACDPVKQAEMGVRFRRSNLTGCHVDAQDSNINASIGAVLAPDYRAKGVEREGGIRHGLLSLTGGATWPDAMIVRNRVSPAIDGDTPRHQASLIFRATPQNSNDRFAVGAVFIGTTDSYAQDVNLPKMPGYVISNTFVQPRPAERLPLSPNVTNLFDTLAPTSIDEDRIPATGIVRGGLLNGRTISMTARPDFRREGGFARPSAISSSL